MSGHDAVYRREAEASVPLFGREEWIEGPAKSVRIQSASVVFDFNVDNRESGQAARNEMLIVFGLKPRNRSAADLYRRIRRRFACIAQ